LPVTLAGPDLVETPCSDVTDAMVSHFGAFEVHSYGGAYDWRNEHAFDWCYPMREGVEKFAAWVAYARRHGKPFFLGELGTFDYGMGESKPEPGSYDAALKDVEYAIRLANVGVEGFCRWSFVNRGNLDGQWQLVDTWDPEKECPRATIEPHPNSFYLWGLLCRFISAGATVLDAKLTGGGDGRFQRVFGTAVRNPDDSLTLAVVNDSETWGDLQVSVAGTPAETTFHRYRVGLVNRDDSRAEVQPEGPFGADFTDTLPPMSFTVYSTIRRRHDECAAGIGPYACGRKSSKNGREEPRKD